MEVELRAFEFKDGDFRCVDMSDPESTTRFGMTGLQSARVALHANQLLRQRLPEFMQMLENHLVDDRKILGELLKLRGENQELKELARLEFK